ncbi:hypothetical protein DRH29_01745 [candidate division Kazan bacterium]|uniref:Uncharacterized protein n=1 Tax=candidate division Kazan bacterium TaxID=2202143 RepID=A0A420ZDC1_UNCK3|nr:MAG: hypothetical protein DRH29_01745 [candidate division Kazan bacterium]
MNEEDAHNNWGLPYGQSNWFNVNEPVVEPFFITIEHPSAGEVWYVGQNKDIEFELNRALTGPINIEFVLCQIDPGVCLDAEWLEPMIINPQDGTGPFTATWEVGTKLDGTLISNIEDFADNALISLYVTGDDVGSFGKNFNSEAFSIEESGEIPPLPLNGVYYSADIELTESIESFTSANVDWGFIDGYGLDPSGPVGGANVEVGMAFIDADGNSITLDGLNEIPQHSDSQDRDYYLIFTNATINSEYSDISRFNVATNLSEVKSVQFKVDLFTYDWNVTRPYFESLSVSYDPVTITEDPLTITVTPEDIITNPGGTFIYTILVHDNDINDELRLSDVVLAYDISEFVGDLESYELVSMDGDEYGGDTFGWELDMLVASEGLEHLNEDLTFTIDVTIDGEIVVTSVPLSLLITGQGVVSINFTTTLQMGEIESPIYRPDPQFTLYIYEVADIDRYGQVATVTVPASMISIAEDGTYSGSIATTELQPGFTYAVFAKTSQHISRRATEDITIPDSTGDDITFDLVFPELLVGDIGGSYDVFGNRDDSINSHDYSIFLGLFGNPVGEGLWSIADFNNDGSVNANDFWPFGKTGNFQEMGDLGQILGDL